MNHSLKVTKTIDGKEGTLTLAGDLTMAHVLKTKKAVLGAIGEVDTLRLDLKEVAEVDVSFVQLLCAAHRECFLSEKGLFLEGEVSNVMENLLERAGYLKQCGCFPAAKKSCLWSECSLNHS